MISLAIRDPMYVFYKQVGIKHGKTFFSVKVKKRNLVEISHTRRQKLIQRESLQ